MDKAIIFFGWSLLIGVILLAAFGAGTMNGVNATPKEPGCLKAPRNGGAFEFNGDIYYLVPLSGRRG